MSKYIPASMYVTRSMTGAGTSTDNDAMEAINGWTKTELFMDFHITGENQWKQKLKNTRVTCGEINVPIYVINFFYFFLFSLHSFTPSYIALINSGITTVMIQ